MRKSKISHVELEKQLHRRVSEERARLESLQRENALLRLRHDLVSACCEILLLMRNDLGMQQMCEDQQQTPSSSLLQCTEEELMLLVELELEPSLVSAAIASEHGSLKCRSSSMLAEQHLAAIPTKDCGIVCTDCCGHNDTSINGLDVLSSPWLGDSLSTPQSSTTNIINNIDNMCAWTSCTSSGSTGALCSRLSSTQCISSNGHCSSSTGLSAGADGTSMAPPEAPLLLFNHLLAQPLLSGTEQISLPEVRTLYRNAVHALGSQLQELQRAQHRADVQAAGAAQAAIRSVLYTHMYRLVSLARSDRLELVAALMASWDCETSKSAADHSCLDQYRTAATLIGITQQQVQHMTSQYLLFQQVLQPMQVHRQQLQQQLVASDIGSSSKSHNAAMAVGPGCSGPLPAAVQQQELLIAEWHHQQQQQHQTMSKLKAALKKELLLQLAADSCMMSCLSWGQVASLAVLTWPVPVQAANLAKALST